MVLDTELDSLSYINFHVSTYPLSAFLSSPMKESTDILAYF